MSKSVTIITDGACCGNPGPAGWACILRYRNQEKILSGGIEHGTNNVAELTAVIRGLESLKERCDVEVISDSQYVINGITKWVAGWKRKGWKSKTGAPVKNRELWQALDAAASRHSIRWTWVRGHNGHADNELVDGLAVAEAEKAREKTRSAA